MNDIVFENPDLAGIITEYSLQPLTAVNRVLRESIMRYMNEKYPYWNEDIDDLASLYMQYTGLKQDWSAFLLIIAAHPDDFCLMRDAFKLAMLSSHINMAKWIYNNYIETNVLYNSYTEYNIINMIENPIDESNATSILTSLNMGDLENGNVPANVREFISSNLEAEEILREHLFYEYTHDYDIPDEELEDRVDEEIDIGTSEIAIKYPYDPDTTYFAHNNNVRLRDILNVNVPLTPSVYEEILKRIPSATDVILPDRPIYRFLFPLYSSKDDISDDFIDQLIYAITHNKKISQIE